MFWNVFIGALKGVFTIWLNSKSYYLLNSMIFFFRQRRLDYLKLMNFTMTVDET